MATEERDEGEGGLFDQDPFVEQMRPEPSAPPSEVVVLEGLAGRSDREGWARLYFNRMLTYYAEFRREDIVFTEAIPPEQAPMVGLKCTRVGIRKDAVIEYTRATRAKPRDEFDLDVRLARGQQGVPRLAAATPNTCNDPCVTRDTCGITCETCGDTCRTCEGDTCITCMGPCVTIVDTCRTCDTCGGATCNTCQTQCNQQTCRATCRTCQTECAPCQTCPATQCQTQCNTCNTCQAPCPTHFGFTCNPFC